MTQHTKSFATTDGRLVADGERHGLRLIITHEKENVVEAVAGALMLRDDVRRLRDFLCGVLGEEIPPYKGPMCMKQEWCEGRENHTGKCSQDRKP